MFENMIHSVIGHLKIRDKHTHEMFVDKQNAIHFGNISWAVSQALAGNEEGHIGYMVFGSGGTSVDSSGNIAYRSPNTSNLQDPTAAPYRATYWKQFSDAISSTARLEVVPGTSNFSDLKSNVSLGPGEPVIGQDTIDQAPVTNDIFVFDEIALYTSVGGILGEEPIFEPGTGRMLTHVIFHPVQKANNRELEIEYTIRVQMGP